MGIGIGTGRGGARPGAGRPRKHPPVAAEARVRAETDPRTGIRALLEAQGVALAGLRQRHRDEGEWPLALMRRMTALERAVHGERQDISRPLRQTRRRPSG
jgi:hypothetical protein